MDNRTPEQRRRIMQAVKSRNTKPELIVRRLLHSMGFRYRLHRRDLPGRPDIVFVSRRKAIFVHGCFWHGHDCPKGRLPKSRLDYWQPKLDETTKPELIVRRLLHSMGFRYRLHRRDLPGRPDIVFVSRRKAIFVHGCFWHGHDCPKGRLPKSRLDYWQPKLDETKNRDRIKQEQLQSLGWRVLVIWQCETVDTRALAPRLQDFVGDSKNSLNI